MQCIDTTYLIDFLKGKISTSSLQQLCTTQINIYEVLFGIQKRHSPHKRQELELAEQFFSTLVVLPLTDLAVMKAAEIAGQLALKGKEIGHNDCFVAAIALTHGVTTIVTQDVEHFRRIPGIAVESY